MAPEPFCKLLSLPLEILQEITGMLQCQDVTYATKLLQLKAMKNDPTWAREWQAQTLVEGVSEWYGRSLWAWSMTCKRLRLISEPLRFQTISLKGSDCDYYLTDIHPRYAHHFEILLLDKLLSASSRTGKNDGPPTFSDSSDDYSNTLRTILLLSSSFVRLKALHVKSSVAAKVFTQQGSTPAAAGANGARESSEAKALGIATRGLFAKVTKLRFFSKVSRHIPYFFTHFRHTTSIELKITKSSDFEDCGATMSTLPCVRRLKLVLKAAAGGHSTLHIPDNWLCLDWQCRTTLRHLMFATDELGTIDWTFLVLLGKGIEELNLSMERVDATLSKFNAADGSFPRLKTLSVSALVYGQVRWLWSQLSGGSPLSTISLALAPYSLGVNDVLSPLVKAVQTDFGTTLRCLNIKSCTSVMDACSIQKCQDFAALHPIVQFVPRYFDSGVWEASAFVNREDDEAISWKKQGLWRIEQLEMGLDYLRGKLDSAKQMEDVQGAEELVKLLGPVWTRREIDSY